MCCACFHQRGGNKAMSCLREPSSGEVQEAQPFLLPWPLKRFENLLPPAGETAWEAPWLGTPGWVSAHQPGCQHPTEAVLAQGRSRWDALTQERVVAAGV